MTVPLLIIDVQQGFMTPATAHVPGRVEALQADYAAVLATRFVNPEGSAHRRLLGWDRFAPGSAETALAFRPREDAHILEKRLYTCVDGPFLERLARLGAGEVHLCGIATDNCVLKCAVDLFEAGLRPVVLARACASHAGPDYHQWGLRILRRLIGAAQVVEGAEG
ncbi:MAG TPA: isochorismatase family cysteine hydrolase [Alphaproteobacteria bacterium]|jgi:nicotinamidase-related amidase